MSELQNPGGVPPKDGASDLALKALGAGAAGLGSLGLVTGVGGAIMFERFSQAGIPAEQAVAVQPRTVLLAVGAEALIPMASAMLLLVAVYWIAAKRLKIPSELFALAAGAGAIVYYLAVVELHFKLDVLGLVVLVTAIACGLWTMLANLTPSIGWRAILLGILTALLASAIGLIRTIDAPKVRGAVVVLTTKPSKVVAGLFIAQTSEQVYLGQVALARPGRDTPKAGSGSIIALSRSEVSTVALSANEGLAAALTQAGLMAQALKEEPDGSLLATRLAESKAHGLTEPQEPDATSPAPDEASGTDSSE
jgi:hypothetical protein